MNQVPTIEQRGAVSTIGLGSGPNAIDEGYATEFLECLRGVSRDPAVRAVILTGLGKSFSVGGDLRSFLSATEPEQVLDRVTHQLHRAVALIAAMPKPVVSAVNGVAAGAGVGLALAADLTLAGASSMFVLAYTRVGLTPDAGTTSLLVRRVGEGRALDLVLTNRQLSAEQAREWGLVSEVVDDADLPGRAIALAEQLAAGPTLAMARAKRLVRGAFNNSLEAELAREAATICRQVGTPEFREGATAFVDKRTPDFSHG